MQISFSLSLILCHEPSHAHNHRITSSPPHDPLFSKKNGQKQASTLLFSVARPLVFNFRWWFSISACVGTSAMATSSKFDLSSSSLDRPLYTAQRGSNITASLDRSGSFRECTENPIMSFLPNMLRSSYPATHGDVESFFNYVHFDQKLLVLDQKSNRHVDYKRHVNAALGISPDESPSSSAKGKLLPCPVPQDVKRVRDSLYLSTVNARKHVKMFDEALSVFNVKKRSRVEGFSSDRYSVMLNDRSISGPSMGKVGPKVGFSSKLHAYSCSIL